MKKSELDNVLDNYSARLRAAFNDDEELDARVTEYMTENGYDWIHPFRRSTVSHPVMEGGLPDDISVKDVKKLRNLMRFAFGLGNTTSAKTLTQEEFALLTGNILHQNRLQQKYRPKDLRKVLVRCAKFEDEHEGELSWERS